MAAASTCRTRARVLLAERLYKRLSGLGLGRVIRPVEDTWTRWGREALFIADDKRALVKTLLSSGRFCRDTPTGGILHPGQISLREVSNGRGLHLVLRRDNRLYAHVDAVAPAISARPDGQCLYSRARASAHIRQEVLPLLWGFRINHSARRYQEVVPVSPVNRVRGRSVIEAGTVWSGVPQFSEAARWIR